VSETFNVKLSASWLIVPVKVWAGEVLVSVEFDAGGAEEGSGAG